MLPVGLLIAMGLLHVLGLSSNIMSLGGIAIALGAMVDAAIVMIENAHKHLERASPGASRAKILTDAAIEVRPALFFSLAVITVSKSCISTGTSVIESSAAPPMANRSRIRKADSSSRWR
jgi:Cu(I)/Ag(I) efflux system membrane protein CusA/SilA